MGADNIPIGMWSGSDATRDLHETIRALNETATPQTRQLISLTKVLAVLATAMLLAVVVQVALATR